MVPYRFCYKSKAKGKFLYFETAIDIFFMFDLGNLFLFDNLINSFEFYNWILQKRSCHYEKRSHY